MIEKLPFTEIHTGGENMVDRVEFRPVAPYEMQHKINELVDAVNRLEESNQGVVNNSIADGGRIRLLQEQIHALKTRLENVQSDPYAEQRKWIGKACRFWDGNAQTKAFGQLNQIDPLDDGQNAPYQTNYGQWYEHCEPVKPDDDIIYKGGNNE